MGKQAAIVVWIVLGILACAVNAAGGAVKVGQKAPEIKAQKWLNTTGEVSLAKLRGKIVVVEFWATWCPPCRESIPHLNTLYNRYKDKGVVVLGLSDERLTQVAPFVEQMNKGKKNMEYIVGAGSNDVANYGVTGIPHAFLVDPEGKVVWTGHPMAGLDKAIEKALKDTPPKVEKKEAAPPTVDKKEATPPTVEKKEPAPAK
jgi:thiol-disulfide isomerase/thioredoxin